MPINISNALARAVMVYAVCAANAGCASAASLFSNSSFNASKIEAETTTPVETNQKPWSISAQEILMLALSLNGVQYKYGGNSPEAGFDCSGYVRYVFQQAISLTLPHGARAISQLGDTVAASDLKPGDLVFFNTLKSAFSHVGIYLGNNRFIHAPSSGGGIKVANMKESYWSQRFNGARRIDGDNLAAVKSMLRAQN